MNDFSLDISRKIEPNKAAVLAAVNRAAGKTGIPFFIVGGAARDFILQNGYDVRTRRVTLDVDIGVRVSSWGEYTRIIESLLSDENFSRTEIEHRYESPEPEVIQVDVLPFGKIEMGKRTVRWQRDDNETNMLGFEEAYSAAIKVKIISSPPVVVKMTSLAGLALLKLISWNEHYDTRDRDAKDFKEIMNNYLETYPNGSIYTVHPDIVTGDDYELISARALGRDLGKTGGSAIRALLIETVGRECNPEGSLKFVLQMQSGSFDPDADITRDIKMLKALYNGIIDTQ